MWHLDGNHKLIRWKLVIHGAIDGYSRLITYLKCSSNNCSETVLTCFVEGVQEFGMPSRIRTDHGGENVCVWGFMEHNRGSGRNSFIAGRSVHNTRIERLWRDVTRLVSSSYISVFTDLESNGALNPDNESDLFALHYIYLARINKSLFDFQQAWNNHSISTENNLSPLQMYTAYSQGSQLFDETIDPLTYGVDSISGSDDEAEDEESVVVVPRIHIPLSTTSLQRLHSINPLENTNDFGKQLYTNTVHLLYSLMMDDELI